MRKSKKPLIAAVAGLMVLQGALHAGYIQDFWRQNYSPGKLSGDIRAELSPDQILLQMFGFREFLAGILWVRADGFFDAGNYDAVLPIIRLCTILDPKQIDVYATGMWHIGYNFTDEEQRSDRRYVPSALALGKEGARQNAHTYEMFFETGWMWYHKVDDDYHQAVRWFEAAHEREDIIPARRNLLNMAYQRNGQIEEAVDLMYRLHGEAEKKFNEDAEFGNRQNLDTIEGNLDNMLVRMVQRGWVAQQNGTFEQGPYDPKPPFDVGFSAKATVIEPRVIRFEGTWNVVPVGTRVRVVLRDADYNADKLAGLDWDASDAVNLTPPKDRTYMQDQLFVRNTRFNRRVDMSKDPTMYPFSGDKYTLEFFYNPRSAPPHIQDKFSWNGEGMTDKNFLRQDVRKTFKYEPVKKDKDGKVTEWKLVEIPVTNNVIYTKLEFTKDQILRRGEWARKVPVVKTSNFVETERSYNKTDVILVPSLRSGQAAQPKK